MSDITHEKASAGTATADAAELAADIDSTISSELKVSNATGATTTTSTTTTGEAPPVRNKFGRFVSKKGKPETEPPPSTDQPTQQPAQEKAPAGDPPPASVFTDPVSEAPPAGAAPDAQGQTVGRAFGEVVAESAADMAEAIDPQIKPSGKQRDALSSAAGRASNGLQISGVIELAIVLFFIVATIVIKKKAEARAKAPAPASGPKAPTEPVNNHVNSSGHLRIVGNGEIIPGQAGDIPGM